MVDETIKAILFVVTFSFGQVFAHAGRHPELRGARGLRQKTRLFLGSNVYVFTSVGNAKVVLRRSQPLKLFENSQVLSGRYDEKVDTWSIGVIAYLLLSGKHPFTGKTVEQVEGWEPDRRTYVEQKAVMKPGANSGNLENPGI